MENFNVGKAGSQGGQPGGRARHRGSQEHDRGLQAEGEPGGGRESRQTPDRGAKVPRAHPVQKKGNHVLGNFFRRVTAYNVLLDSLSS